MRCHQWNVDNRDDSKYARNTDTACSEPCSRVTTGRITYAELGMYLSFGGGSQLRWS